MYSPADVSLLPTDKRVPEAWSVDEMRRIITAAAETPGMLCGIPAGKWWPAQLLTLYDTGLRIGALMALESAQLDFETGWLTVPADHQKQRAEQVFQLQADTLDAIAQTRPGERRELFPWPFVDERWAVLRKRYRKILQRAGLPTDSRCLFHKVRRTSATLIADALGERAAQDHLGHSSLSVTKRYLDPRKMKRRKPSTAALPRLGHQEDVA